MFLPTGDNIQRQSVPILPIALIGANVLVFLIQLRLIGEARSARIANEWFFTTWGLTPAKLMAGEQIWGLATCMFVHGDVWHLLGNMMALWAFSISLEVGIGRWKLLAFYLLFGLAGSLAHVALNRTSTIPLVGASGAIAGLMGAYAVLYGPSSKIKGLFFIGFKAFAVQIPAAVFCLGWFGWQLWAASCDTHGRSGVAFLAHIGGFAVGMAVMYAWRNETVATLQQDRHGNLLLVENAAIEQAAIQVESPNWPVPETCPYCSQMLVEQDRMAFNLARCSNPGCKRLVCLIQEAPGARKERLRRV